VFKEHYEEYDPGELCMYGDMYTSNCISDYKIINDDNVSATGIVSVSGYAANREFHRMEFLRGL